MSKVYITYDRHIGIYYSLNICMQEKHEDCTLSKKISKERILHQRIYRLGCKMVTFANTFLQYGSFKLIETHGGFEIFYLINILFSLKMNRVHFSLCMVLKKGRLQIGHSDRKIQQLKHIAT